MLRLSRRTVLSAAIALAVAGSLPARAQNADTIPGFDEALTAGDPILIHVTAPWWLSPGWPR